VKHQSSGSETKSSESGDKYRAIFEAANAAIIIHDLNNGRILDANRAMLDMYGYSLEELLRLDIEACSEGVPPYTQKEAADWVQKAVEGTPQLFEWRAKKKNGDLFWVEVNLKLINFDNKEHILAIVTDITDRKIAEDKLQASYNQLLDIIEFLPDPTFVIDKSKTVIAWNKAIEKMTTVAKKDTIGKGNYAYAVPFYGKAQPMLIDKIDEPNDVIEANYQSVRRENGRVSAETYLPLLRDGKGAYVLATAANLFDSSGDQIGAIESIHDISERKTAEEAIKKSDERLTLALDSVRDAVWDWRVDTGEVFFSSRWFAMLGYGPHELPQKFETWQELLHPDDKENAEKEVFEHLQSGEPFETEFRMRTKDDQWRWILGRGKMVEQDASGKAIRMLGTHMDITERKIMEERIQQSQKMEAIGSLAGGIAHDFNNILFPIVGLSEMLIEDLPKESVDRNHAKAIFDAGRRGSELVQQILAFSRQTEQRMMPVRIQKILNEVVRLSRAGIPKDIEIHQNLDKNCGFILANPVQIHQVVMNLVTNAYHAIDPNPGTITVTLDEFCVSGETDGSDEPRSGAHARISISDNGSGIDPKIMDKVFDPYFTTKPKDKGTGLGLAVVYGIVKEHGGEILVDSEVGVGTTFEIWLPIYSGGEAQTKPPEKKKHRTGSENILLVDDEAPIANLEKTMLERLGYNVTIRTSSIEALEAFKNAPKDYDLVLTDMTMPNMTGDRLAVEMIKIRPDIPIIIATGFSERINEEIAKEAGVKGFLMKPVLKNEMSEMVRKVLDETKDT
jgi:PAS domain S-box-containing protein